MRFHKILCPIDFSTGSDAAVKTAVRIANEHGAELELAHVWNLPASVSMTHGLVDLVTSDAQRTLEAKRKSVAAISTNKVSAKLLTGVPWSAIVDRVEHDLDIDLIVVGTQGRTGMARFLLGSVSEKILRHAPCSVLVVRPGNEPKPFVHVTCAMDFSVDSEQTTELASALVAPAGEITLVHVTETPLSYFGDGPVSDLVHEIETNAKQLLDYAAVELRQQVAVPVNVKLVDGRFPGARLLDAIESAPNDLVIMGSHGRTGLRRALLGSVAERIVRHAAIPILVARSRDPMN